MYCRIVWAKKGDLKKLVWGRTLGTLARRFLERRLGLPERVGHYFYGVHESGMSITL